VLETRPANVSRSAYGVSTGLSLGVNYQLCRMLPVLNNWGRRGHRPGLAVLLWPASLELTASFRRPLFGYVTDRGRTPVVKMSERLYFRNNRSRPPAWTGTPMADPNKQPDLSICHRYETLDSFATASFLLSSA